MSFKYIIKHNLKKRPIFVQDLVKFGNQNDKGWASMPSKNPEDCFRHLHLKYTREEIKNSKGLKDAIKFGWFIEIDCDPLEENYEVNNGSEELTDIKNKMEQMISMMNNLISNQEVSVQPISMPNLSLGLDLKMFEQISRDITDIKKAANLKQGLDGYEELTPQMAALMSRKNNEIQMIKDNNLSIEKKEIDIDLTDIIGNLDNAE